MEDQLCNKSHLFPCTKTAEKQWGIAEKLNKNRKSHR